jgi:signal transduction histidine kinase
MPTKAEELNALTRELMQKNLELAKALKERERLFSQLVEQEKLAALGGLVAGFAHEVNTPIGIAVTAASVLRDKVDRLLTLLDHEEIDEVEVEEISRDLRQAADLCISNLARASRLVTSFKRVSVDQTAERTERFSVLSLLRDTATSLEPVLRQSGAKLEIHGDEDAQLENAPGALSQVITNLVLNALKHAYPEGSSFQEKRIVLEAWRDMDDHYVIEVRDFGVGIDPEYRRKIFEPFETSARGRGGTGLGLTVVQNIVTSLFRGTVSCDSVLGQGTTFFLRIPLGAPKAGEHP